MLQRPEQSASLRIVTRGGHRWFDPPARRRSVDGFRSHREAEPFVPDVPTPTLEDAPTGLIESVRRENSASDSQRRSHTRRVSPPDPVDRPERRRIVEEDDE